MGHKPKRKPNRTDLERRHVEITHDASYPLMAVLGHYASNADLSDIPAGAVVNIVDPAGGWVATLKRVD